MSRIKKLEETLLHMGQSAVDGFAKALDYTDSLLKGKKKKKPKAKAKGKLAAAKKSTRAAVKKSAKIVRKK